MREIKFRMWDKEYKAMTEPKELEDLVLKATLMNPNNFEWNCGIPVMQFTGLKDANGKEIYEHDVIQIDSFNFKVYYSNGQFIYYERIETGNIDIRTLKDILCFGSCKCIVVGNIYANPELLK